MNHEEQLRATMGKAFLAYLEGRRLEGQENKVIMGELVGILANTTGRLLGGIVKEDNILEALEHLIPVILLSAAEGHSIGAKVIAELQTKEVLDKAGAR